MINAVKLEPGVSPPPLSATSGNRLCDDDDDDDDEDDDEDEIFDDSDDDYGAKFSETRNDTISAIIAGSNELAKQVAV